MKGMMPLSSILPDGNAPQIKEIDPAAAIPGGDVEIRGDNLSAVAHRLPVVMLGGLAAPVLLSREERMVVRVPEESESGALRVLRNGAQSNSVNVKVARLLAADVHMVASPVMDEEGRAYATYSGSRGQETPVSVFRTGPDGEMQPFAQGIMNATGMALDGAGFLYVSSRHEGTVYRISPNGTTQVYAEGMGVATGIAFDGEQNLYVGDRSGTIFKIAPDRQIFVHATLEPSVAAYHLAFGQEGTLYVSVPTTSGHDCVYSVDSDGSTKAFYRGLGRPQGLAVDIAGDVYAVASLRGRQGVVRLPQDGEPSLVVAGRDLVGFSFTPQGTALLATSTAIYDVDLGIEGWRVV
jgi:sugar lactone lactonase YvrE